MRSIVLLVSTLCGSLVPLAAAGLGPVAPPCRIGEFVAATSTFRLDVNGDGAWSGDAPQSGADVAIGVDAASGPGAPLVGDWNGDLVDDVGKQVGTRYAIDLDGDAIWEDGGGDRATDFAKSFGAGVPIIGDWDGDGRDQIGTYIPATGRFLLDANGDGIWNGIAGGDVNTIVAAFAIPGQQTAPVVGDWNGDGTTDLGVFFVDRGMRGQAFALDANGNGRWDGVAGGDVFTAFGYANMGPGSPLIGDWNGDGVDDLGKGQWGSRFFLDFDGVLGPVGFMHFPYGGDKIVYFAGLLPDGTSLVCDWDGDGDTDIGRVIDWNAGHRYLLDTDGSLRWDASDANTNFVLPEGRGTPLAGHFDVQP